MKYTIDWNLIINTVKIIAGAIGEFFVAEWDSIIPIIISLIALGVSIYANYRVGKTRRQEHQEPLYNNLRQLLEVRCNYFSGADIIKGCYSKSSKFSKDEEESIKRQTARYFGKNEYNQLCEILKLCQEAKKYDTNLRIAFNQIKLNNPRLYQQLEYAITSMAHGMPTDTEIKKYTDLLAAVEIENPLETNLNEKKYWNYFECEEQRKKLDHEIKQRKEVLDVKLRKEMMKR